MMRRIVCLFALPLLAIHGISQMAEAFWVGSKSGQLFPIHEEMTHDALRYVKFGDFEIALGNGKTEHFYPDALLQIAQFNRDADNDQTPSHHFDNDLFTESSERLKDLRFHILQGLKREEFQQFTPSASVVQLDIIRLSHKNMGEALHTLQDFYSHSNWVERNGRDQKNLLNTFGKGIVSGGFTPSVCDVFDFANSPLTTGWAWKNAQGDLPADLAGLEGCYRPANKCPHGFVLPCSYGNPPPPGMNKDYPLRPGHTDARYLATQATAHFVKDMLQELLLNPPNTASPVLSKSAAIWAVCQFMGVPDAFSKCLTSHTVTVQKLNEANGQPTLEGLVQSSSGNITPAIDCGLLCEGTAIAGTSVQLTAKNSGNWRFVRWAEGGVCAGSTSPDCSFALNGNLLAKPEFALFDAVISLSPRASFIRSNAGDSPFNPIIIDLSTLGIAPGQVIELSSFGFFVWGIGQADDARATNMVFSTSNELLPSTDQYRVPGAIPTSMPGIFTTNTCREASLPTDISQDFAINVPENVTVPAGALYLFAGTFDCAYWDNSDPNGDLIITIRHLPN